MTSKKEFLCPLGHWSKVKFICYAGGVSAVMGFGMPHDLAVCETCGIVFDFHKVERRDERDAKEDNQEQTDTKAWQYNTQHKQITQISHVTLTDYLTVLIVMQHYEPKEWHSYLYFLDLPQNEHFGRETH